MSKTSFIYILSQRYSGSTLLSFLLGTHPQIATIGERRKFFVHSYANFGEKALDCSCGKSFPECEHWNTIKASLMDRFGTLRGGINPTEFKFSENKYPATKGPPKNVATQNAFSLYIFTAGMVLSVSFIFF